LSYNEWVSRPTYGGKGQWDTRHLVSCLKACYMVRHHSLAVLTSAAVLAAFGAAAAEQQQTQAPTALARTHRPVPAAVLQPVEAEPLGASSTLTTNPAELMPKHRTDQARGMQAQLKPSTPFEAPPAEFPSVGAGWPPRYADSWVPPAHLYTVANRDP
jgi:hypothetical protein